LFKNIAADVVHTHDPRPLIYAAPAARWAGVSKIIHTQHGRVFGVGGRQRWLTRRSAAMVDHFVCVSSDIGSLAHELGIDPKKTLVIRNGVGAARFVRPGDDQGVPVVRDSVVCVARLSSEKGISTLISAMAIAHAKSPSLRLLIAGEGPLRKSLEDQILACSLENVVRLLGSVDDIPGLLRRAKVFVLPSLSEGVSLTLLESMLAEVAIVATNVGGTPEVIRDRKTGLLVPPLDAEAMADAIIELWDNDLLRRSLVEQASANVADHFGIDLMIDSYDAIYDASAINEAGISRSFRNKAFA